MNVLFIDEKIKKFIENLDHKTRAKADQLIATLEHYGHDIGLPYSRCLGSGLFELRIRGQQEVRIFYVFYEGGAMLLHGFVKKSEQIPENELRIAYQKRRLLDE